MSQQGQLRIESKGHTPDTTVSVDGHELTGVTGVTWSLDAKTWIAKATLTVDGVELSMDAAMEGQIPGRGA